MIDLFSPLLLQISVDGLEQAAKQSILDGVLVSIILILFGVAVYLFKLYVEKNNEVKKEKDSHHDEVIELQKEFSKQLKDLNDKHVDEISDIITKSQTLENERNEKFLQSERGLMDLLTAVNNVMKLGDRERQNENKNIMDKLNELNRRIENFKK
jgi:hypothetical protein